MWPDLVYTELISLILCSVVLIVWSILLKAPLEQPANRAVTPNPSKAPWYFLGLQEMLVYFDPWLAGVVLPSLIIVGLIAIPYIDKNPKGNGYYTFTERKVEITMFLFGFVILWSSLIVLGTFLRGPNWNFLRAVRILGHAQARSADQRRSVRVFLGADAWAGAADELLHQRAAGHPARARSTCSSCPWCSRRARSSRSTRSGPPRFYVTVFLFLMMMSLPIKMLLRGSST